VPGLGRFRCNVYRQRGTVGFVFRVIPTVVPTIDELELPEVLKRIAEEERGLVLVTGTTGSGKSTSLAAMINHINHSRSAHVMTVEDPSSTSTAITCRSSTSAKWRWTRPPSPTRCAARCARTPT